MGFARCFKIPKARNPYIDELSGAGSVVVLVPLGQMSRAQGYDFAPNLAAFTCGFRFRI